jgi:hypothetical protein
MNGVVSPTAKPPSASHEWEAQYEKDFAAQKSSGPVVFTEEQRRKNKEVLGRVSDLLPFEDIYKVNDCDLIYRFLIGKHWNVNTTEKGLREYIQLRKKDHLDGLLGEQLHPTIGSVLCPCYSNGVPCPIYGLDKDGLPILWLSPDASKVIAAMKQFTEKQLLRGQMRAIELGRFVCKARGVDRCTYVIDLGGITMSSVNKATLGFLKGVMNMLQIAYPEIMRRLLVFNTGWAVSAAWKVLRPLVDVRVQDKIKFESGAPTLAALQPYMAADQVHPAFGGTGKENVLDPLIESEVLRVRRLADGEAPSPSVSVARGPSASSYDNGSLFDMDPRALHSFYCPTPLENQQSIATDDSPTLGRVVIGAPRAVSAWMANMADEEGEKNALDMSLSVASSSNDYAVESGDAAGEEVSSAPPAKTGGKSPTTPSSASQGRGRVSAASPRSHAAAANLPPLSSDEPLHHGGAASLDGGARAGEEKQVPMVALSLTYGADGSITGYCGQKCVGQFRNGRLYASPREPDGDSMSSAAASPSVQSPGSLPGNHHSSARSGGASSGRGSEQQQQCPSPKPSRTNTPIGELLYEAGHPIHNFYIVCDGQRNARYLLRRSRLRTRVSVYNVVGGAPVRTEKNNHHYVEGERAKLGVAVPSTDAATHFKGDWMLFGEDVTQRTPGQHIKRLFSKAKRSPASATDGSGVSYAEKEKEKDCSWPASMFAAIRSSAASATSSPSKRKSKGAGSRATDDVHNGGASAAADRASSRVAARKSSMAGNDTDEPNGGTQLLLAENKRQIVYFYNLLTKNPLSDLFALAVAITLSWSGELDSLKDKTGLKGKRNVSEDNLMA